MQKKQSYPTIRQITYSAPTPSRSINKATANIYPIFFVNKSKKKGYIFAVAIHYATPGVLPIGPWPQEVFQIFHLFPFEVP